MNNSKRRIVTFFVAAAMMAAAFTGCGGNNSGSGTPSNTDPVSSTVDAGDVNDTVIIATANETPSMHPYDHNATAGSYMNQLTFNSLFKTDLELNAVPDLVADYKNVSETVWEFTLKEGIKFHDGSIMNAEDVKASLDFSKTFPAVGQYTKDVGEVAVTGELTFTLTTEKPYANLLMDLTHHGNNIVPKKLIDEGNDFNKNPIGSGPYKYVKWTLGDKVEFEAFPDYHDGAPAIKYMTWKIIPEGASRTIALEAGEIDMIIEVEAMDAARIEANENLVLQKKASTTHNYMMINNEVAPFDNQKFRQALQYAIDKDAVTEVALNGLGIAATAQMPLGLPGTSETNSIGYDVEKAKALLTESGVDAATVSMPIICSDDTKRRAAEVIQSNLAEIGITASIESMDLATYLSKTSEGEYVASLGNYTSSSNLGYIKGVMHSDSIDASNRSRLNNPEVDALINKADVTLDETERNKVLEELSALLNELSPQIPTYQPELLRAYKKNLGGAECSPAGMIEYGKLKWN